MKYLLVTISFFSILSCSSTRLDKPSKEALKAIVKHSSNKIYYESITSDIGKPLDTLFEEELTDFYLCTPTVEDVTGKISVEELAYIKEKFRLQSVGRIDRSVTGLHSKMSKKHLPHKTETISFPVVFRGDSMAVYYYRNTYGGGFNLLQKKNDEWQMICSKSVWAE
ncbi:hypothetical protein [Galbibacter mesophilus]|uniref:hypothetical protein n=1 Tax=Galbibacter mesophilus TaxID=379069 RepID=UPI00191D1157|nr:hypothetical protein [Galbibacter mesophilus]MCM5661453.1 hypothetical protein [Galbibacter mesophilus]